MNIPTSATSIKMILKATALRQSIELSWPSAMFLSEAMRKILN